MDAPTESADDQNITRICVFVPLSRWSVGQWVRSAIGILVGGTGIVGIGHATWIGVRTQRWEIAIAVLALLPWWWLFGPGWVWLFKSIRRGGHPLVLLVSENGMMALGENDEGTLVRPFAGPVLHETEDELIVENSMYSMVARLPKDQVSAEHAELIRRVARGRPAGQA